LVRNSGFEELKPHSLYNTTNSENLETLPLEFSSLLANNRRKNIVNHWLRWELINQSRKAIFIDRNGESNMNNDDSDNNDRFAYLKSQMKAHMPATQRTSDTIDIARSEEDGGGENSAPQGASAKMTQQAHAQKYKVSSHSASEAGHSKTSTAGHESHLPHLKQLESKAQASVQKPQKPPAPPKLSIKPAVPPKPIGFAPNYKPKFRG
jgi:hypothetical protein